MKILIVYHSRLGSVEKMARLIARGVESVDNCEAILRSVPEVSSEPSTLDIPDSGDPFVEIEDLKQCDGLITVVQHVLEICLLL